MVRKSTIERRRTNLEANRSTLDLILDKTCNAFKVSREQVLAYHKSPKVNEARKYAITLAREITKLGYETLILYFNKHHSTLVLAVISVNKDRKERDLYNKLLKECMTNGHSEIKKEDDQKTVAR